MLSYKYQCVKCDGITEEWHKSGEAPQNVECKFCASLAKRVWGFAKANTWSDRHSGRKWEKMRNQKMRQEYKQIDPSEW